ncbi:MAG: regulatory iron-sulfur-containing complex subunit RicT [Candidatus Sericytochromatia bacterium]|nr:regulatory iron-sulfur-containing complex subunit RicT [Candidatus Sericytochromatia bacterium]
MARLAIRFRPGDIRLLEHAPEGLLPRTPVVFELDGGLDCRPLSVMANPVVAAHGSLGAARFVRVATEADLVQLESKTTEEVKARGVCLTKIAQHALPMKLVDALYTLDFSRLTFLYTSEGRVDFRDLLRDLTGTFRRTRILLKQIGVRDEARHLSGVGPCGKELCCSTFIREFAPINIKLAKDQDMSLNPAKLSGACGRLKCCLSYEVEAYRAAKKQLPRQGARVLTGGGEGRVLEVQAAHERALVELSDGTVVALAPHEMNVLAPAHPGDSAPAPTSGSDELRPAAAPNAPSAPPVPPRNVGPTRERVIPEASPRASRNDPHHPSSTSS